MLIVQLNDFSSNGGDPPLNLMKNNFKNADLANAVVDLTLIFRMIFCLQNSKCSSPVGMPPGMVPRRVYLGVTLVRVLLVRVSVVRVYSVQGKCKQNCH